MRWVERFTREFVNCSDRFANSAVVRGESTRPHVKARAKASFSTALLAMQEKRSTSNPAPSAMSLPLWRSSRKQSGVKDSLQSQSPWMAMECNADAKDATIFRIGSASSKCATWIGATRRNIQKLVRVDASLTINGNGVN